MVKTPRLQMWLVVFVVMAGPAVAQTPDPTIADVGALLGKLLLVLVLLESAMAALFNWRAYLVVLSGRAWKTPIMFGLGLLVVIGFDYDFMETAILKIAGGTASEAMRWASVTLSAMVIAGGSQGVHCIETAGPAQPDPDAEEICAEQDQALVASRDMAGGGRSRSS